MNQDEIHREYDHGNFWGAASIMIAILVLAMLGLWKLIELLISLCDRL